MRSGYRPGWDPGPAGVPWRLGRGRDGAADQSWGLVAVMVLAMVLAASSLSELSPVPDLEALLRMGLAVLCGLAVGLNRAHHGGDRPHPNRVRVHVLVGLSSCLLLLAAGPDLDARSRAIQGVAAGVGFLGAGEIMMPPATPDNAPHEVRGLSSAASIWFTAALGITVAASSPVLALVALVLALITLSDRPRDGGRRSGGPGSQ